MSQESDLYGLHLPGFLALWLPAGFGQWEALVRDKKAGGEKGWDI